jgi:hypothetical protein
LARGGNEVDQSLLHFFIIYVISVVEAVFIFFLGNADIHTMPAFGLVFLVLFLIESLVGLRGSAQPVKQLEDEPGNTGKYKNDKDGYDEEFDHGRCKSGKILFEFQTGYLHTTTRGNHRFLMPGVVGE